MVGMGGIADMTGRLGQLGRVWPLSGPCRCARPWNL